MCSSDLRDQQRNWETVQQAIGLIAQPIEIEPPRRLDNINLEYLAFGEFFQGQHTVWAWVWAVEHADVYTDQRSRTGKLQSHFDQIPFISGLDETARFMLPIFYPYGSIRNIYFIDRYIDINNI